MNVKPIKCPVCGNEDAKIPSQKTFDGETVTCPQCGEYKVTGSLIAAKGDWVGIKSHLLSHYIRTKYDNGEIVKLDTNNINELKNLPEIRVVEQTDLLLKAYADDLSSRGEHLRNYHNEKGEDRVYYNDPKYIAKIGAKNAQELEWLVRGLFDSGYLDGTKNLDGHGNYRYNFQTISIKGWNKIEELNRQTNFKQGFVAMWFDDSMNYAKKAIPKAIKKAGFEYKLLNSEKDKHFLGKIDDKIIAEIKRSRFLIAEVTGERPNVYYEAGFAHGLGIPVIWLCRGEDFISTKKNPKEVKLHFDTRQFSHIVWLEETHPNYDKEKYNLEEQLYQRIRAVID